MSEPKNIKRSIINNYLGFRAVGEHTSAGIFVLLALIVLFSAISLVVLIQDNLDKDNTIINVRNVNIVWGTLIGTYLIILGNLLGRYAYDLIDGFYALSWILITTILYGALSVYLYTYDERDQYTEKRNNYMNVLLGATLLVALGVSLSPFSCQIANIVFNYSSNANTTQNLIISEIIRKIPNEQVEELVRKIPNLFDNQRF